MDDRIITDESIHSFREYLRSEERSFNTIVKYTRDVSAFRMWIGNNSVAKEKVIDYKNHIYSIGYKTRSINSMLAAVNSFFDFMDWSDLKVKAFRLQKEACRDESKELSRSDYERLCNTAQDRKNTRLNLILQTICGTGIRVGELEYITAEAVKAGKAVVRLKGKVRIVLIVKKLRSKLLHYLKEQKIKEGPVFVTKTGKPVNRTNIWREMKSLCSSAHVDSEKVFPHNLRHLFARIFYELNKDMSKLADILGHSSVDTTRIYLQSSPTEHLRCMENMHLII